MPIESRILELIGSWFGGSLKPGDGIPAATLSNSIPAALRNRLPQVVLDWYRCAGIRFEVPTGHMHLTPPEDLEIEAGLLLLYNDPHAGLLAGIKDDELQADDPRVFDDCGHLMYGSFNDFLHALLLADRLSLDEHATKCEPVVPRELVFGTQLRDRIRETYQLLPFKPLQTYPMPAGCEPELYAGADVLALVDGANWATITARTLAAWEGAERFVQQHAERGDPMAHAAWLYS